MFVLIGQTLLALSEATNLLLGDDKIHFCKMKSDRDLLLLQKAFEKADGIKLPIEYLKQGKAFVCVNNRLEIQGGFALIEQGPFRCLEQIPDCAPQTMDHSVTELTAVCLTAGPLLRRTRYWAFVIGTTLNGDGKHIIYAVDTKKTALRERMFNHIRRHTIYEGPVKKLNGMLEESFEAVEITSKAKLTRGFLKIAISEMSKSIQRKQNLFDTLPAQRLATVVT